MNPMIALSDIRNDARRPRRSVMRRVAALALTLASAAVAVPAFASDQTGNVTSVAMAGGRVLFWMSGTRTTRPGCDCCARWEIVVNDANGQAKMSMIMTAYAQGKSVYISGSGACVAGSNDTEGVSYMQSN